MIFRNGDILAPWMVRDIEAYENKMEKKFDFGVEDIGNDDIKDVCILTSQNQYCVENQFSEDKKPVHNKFIENSDGLQPSDRKCIRVKASLFMSDISKSADNIPQDSSNILPQQHVVVEYSGGDLPSSINVKFANDLNDQGYCSEKIKSNEYATEDYIEKRNSCKFREGAFSEIITQVTDITKKVSHTNNSMEGPENITKKSSQSDEEMNTDRAMIYEQSET